jgi:hypothetical protein
VTETPHQHHEHHTADPAALEDPVHHDVAEHELEVESESDDEDTDDPEPAPAGQAYQSYQEGQPDTDADAGADSDWEAAPAVSDPTGDDRVDAAAGRLAEVRSLPNADHVEVYEDVHRRLQGALTDLDGS